MSPVLQPGTMISPSVRLVRTLGSGNMGSVWVAEHLALQTQVAVKFMSESLGADPVTRARFSREAVAASQVKSPHVVQTFDHGVTSEGVPFIVMELLEGQDLASCLERGPLTLPKTIGIVSQVCLALTRAHAMGVVHRDIKPANIFLCDVGGAEPFVKLLDFGIAKTTNAVAGYATSSGMMGTPFYMSPEQFIDASKADARSDLWSLAMVVYECLTGSLPFKAETIGALAIQVVNGEFEPITQVHPGLPLALDAWFARACAKQPIHRFQSAREFIEALASVASADFGAAGGYHVGRPTGFSLPPPTNASVSYSSNRPGTGGSRSSVPPSWADARATTGGHAAMASESPPTAPPPATKRPTAALWLVAASFAMVLTVGVGWAAWRASRVSPTATAAANAPSVLAPAAHSSALTITPPLPSSTAVESAAPSVPSAAVAPPASGTPSTSASVATANPHPITAPVGHPTTHRPPNATSAAPAGNGPDGLAGMTIK